MIDDVRHLVPTDYWRKHLSPDMRDRTFKGTVNGHYYQFNVLCKIDAKFSPRELVKLKENLSTYAEELAKDRTNVPSVIQRYLTVAVHEKQINGMGKLETLIPLARDIYFLCHGHLIS